MFLFNFYFSGKSCCSLLRGRNLLSLPLPHKRSSVGSVLSVDGSVDSISTAGGGGPDLADAMARYQRGRMDAESLHALLKNTFGQQVSEFILVVVTGVPRLLWVIELEGLKSEIFPEFKRYDAGLFQDKIHIESEFLTPGNWKQHSYFPCVFLVYTRKCLEKLETRELGHQHLDTSRYTTIDGRADQYTYSISIVRAVSRILRATVV